MPTRGNPAKPALLVIDVQRGVVRDAWRRDEVIGNCARLVEQARKSSVPVIWIQHQAEDLPHGSDDWQLVSELRPWAQEHRIDKSYSDSFAATNLLDVLNNLEVGHLVISGAQTNACVRATTYRAAGEGFDVTLVEDAHTTDDLKVDGFDLKAEAMVADLNLSMLWCDWPGQNVASAATEDVVQQWTEQTF